MVDRAFRVVGSREITPDERDFGVRFKKAGSNGHVEYVLEVPHVLTPLLAEREVKDTKLFFALLLTDVPAVARALNWTAVQVIKARAGLQRLYEQLDGLELPGMQAASPAPRFSWGAPPPQHRPSTAPKGRRGKSNI
jgi:hypothetical protein